MNNDLISREALEEVINDLFRSGEYDCNSVLKAIDNAPAVSDRYDEGFRDGYAQCFNDREERKENNRLFQKGGAV